MALGTWLNTTELLRNPESSAGRAAVCVEDLGRTFLASQQPVGPGSPRPVAAPRPSAPSSCGWLAALCVFTRPPPWSVSALPSYLGTSHHWLRAAWLPCDSSYRVASAGCLSAKEVTQLPGLGHGPVPLEDIVQSNTVPLGCGAENRWAPWHPRAWPVLQMVPCCCLEHMGPLHSPPLCPEHASPPVALTIQITAALWPLLRGLPGPSAPLPPCPFHRGTAEISHPSTSLMCVVCLQGLHTGGPSLVSE